MAPHAARTEPMTVVAFLAFGDTRPDGEKWELLDGEMVLNASPARDHQKLVGNIIFALETLRRAAAVDWEAMPGIGVRLSRFSSVEPDVMIRLNDDFRGNNCDDIIVAFEVLSPSTRRNDLQSKRRNYALLKTLAHYVVVSAEKTEVRLYSRASGWQETVMTSLDDVLALDGPVISLPLAAIYAGINPTHAP